MNRRGELERAVRRARIPPSMAGCLLALLYRAGNDTGQITDKYAVTMATVARDAKVDVRTARRSLRHAERHGWWLPVEDTNARRRRRLTGFLYAGADCDCSGETVAKCEACGAPLAGKRAHARFCGDRCRQAAHRADRNCDTTRTGTVTGTDRNRAMSRQESVTVTATNRDKPQVIPHFRQEARDEEELRDGAAGKETEPDPWARDGWRWRQWDADHRAGMWD